MGGQKYPLFLFFGVFSPHVGGETGFSNSWIFEGVWYDLVGSGTFKD